MLKISETEARSRLKLEEKDLFAALGADLAGPQAFPLRPDELADRGKRWLTAQHQYLEKEICSSEKIKQFVSSDSEITIIAVELAKLIAGLVLPVNPITLAVLLAKKGVKAFCATTWERP